MKKSEVNNKNKNRGGKLKTILSIWSFEHKIFPYRRSMKHKARIFSYGGMQQWGVNYWDTYASVVNWIIIFSLLAISSIHLFLSIFMR